MHDIIIPQFDKKKAVETISIFIKDKLKESDSKGLIIGLSGGIDSSLVAYICAKAIGSDKILGLILPSETTSSEDLNDALTVARELGIKYKIVYIDDLIEPFPKLCDECSNSDLANANLKARIRMMLLYYHSNAMKSIVVGTGNRTELLIGYFTKYGDGGVDILPIGNLYKTEICKIASYLGVPKNIVKKAPSAGLWKGQTDEGELGIKYESLDKILYLMVDKGLSTLEVSKCLKIPHDEILRIKEKVDAAKHKLSPPSIPSLR